MLNNSYLILENGAVFKGCSFGYDAETVGELVFTTVMAGYLETLSDPAYYGQIVLQTFPLIGNYGIIPQDTGPGPLHLKAYIVRDWCQEPSNFRSEGNLDSFLRKNKIPGLYGIDTRALTRIVRENGIMNAMISKTPELSQEQWAMLRGYAVSNAVAGCAALRELREESGERRVIDPKQNIAVWDFGDAFRIAGKLKASGVDPLIVRHDASADEILSKRPVGLVLSGGPGDPSENTSIIEEIKKLCCKNIPILGIGLGHQLLALAQGAKTEKLHFGHRGANQPVRHIETGNVFVTIQNHGYSVISDTLPKTALMSHENLSDGTCEGVDYTDIPAFSVQFEPTEEIFNRFAKLLEGGRMNAAE